MEILTAPLSLEYRIWYGFISRLRARGSERVRSTPSEFLVFRKVAENLLLIAENQPKFQTSNPHLSLISQPIWVIQKAKL